MLVTYTFEGEKEKIHAGHILNDERRLNVAITRARSKILIVGCLDTLVREYKPFRLAGQNLLFNVWLFLFLEAEIDKPS